MTDQTSAAPSRAPIAAASAIAIAITISAAVVSVEPATQQFEGEVLKTYLDIGGVPTACRGHTGPDVRMGMTFTHDQCRAFYRADMTKAMRAAIAITPAVTEQRGALESAGDFVLNAGSGWWRPSPMAAAFSRRQWAAGCQAYVGYIVAYKAPKIVPGRNCRTNAKRVLYCDAPGLVNRRVAERVLCAAGLSTPLHH